MDFEAARAEMAVYDGEGDGEGVGDERERRKTLGGLRVEEMDDSGCGKTLAHVGWS